MPHSSLISVPFQSHFILIRFLFQDVQAGQSKLLSKANSWSAPEKSVKIEPEIEANKPTRAASIATEKVQMPPPSLGMGPVAQGSSQGMGPPGPRPKKSIFKSKSQSSEGGKRKALYKHR